MFRCVGRVESCFFFFFSSRRRHTRFDCDWSSDVCSSDLAEARKKAEAELKKLKLMSPMSAEATVVRNYIDVLTGLPWSKKTKIKHDLANAEDVLNADHFEIGRASCRERV